MNFFYCLVNNTIFIVFPLFIYIIYMAFCHNLNIEENHLIFNMSLLTSLYLIIQYGMFTGLGIYQLMLLHIPILIALSKRKKYFSVILSLLLSIYLFNYYDVCAISNVITTIMFFILISTKDERRHTIDYYLNTFTILKTFSFTICLICMKRNLDFLGFLNILIATIVFYISTKIIIKILKVSEDILDLNAVLKELEKEKRLRTSLFQITHEIKNPIAVCKGYLDMVSNATENEKNKYILIVKSEINRTLILMDDFLNYTKIKINPELMDINMLLEDVSSELNLLFIKNKVITKFNISKDEIFINGDYERLKQVFINIFKNSIEAKDDKRNLNIKLDTSLKEDNIQITINDNGIGMDKEELEKIGEMFYTTKKNGTGLGVGLSSEIIKLHHGSIKYSSRKNQGTKVMIKLPIC